MVCLSAPKLLFWSKRRPNKSGCKKSAISQVWNVEHMYSWSHLVNLDIARRRPKCCVCQLRSFYSDQAIIAARAGRKKSHLSGSRLAAMERWPAVNQGDRFPFQSEKDETDCETRAVSNSSDNQELRRSFLEWTETRCRPQAALLSLQNIFLLGKGHRK